MVRLALVLFWFAALPLLGISLGVRSWISAGVSVVLAASLVTYFFWDARRKFFRSVNATPLSQESKVSQVILRLQQLKAPESLRYHFWHTPQVAPELQVWIEKSNRVDLLMSHGLLQNLTEPQLEKILTQGYEMPETRAKIKLQNRVYALALWFREFKGSPARFRYWVCSFWLYPLERLLKIARI